MDENFSGMEENAIQSFTDCKTNPKYVNPFTTVSAPPFKADVVNHPAHYKTGNGLEAIDVIEAFTEGLQGGEATNTGNVLKYMCRWKKKNGLEDLKKAQWYLNRLIGLVEKQKEELTNEN